MASIPNQAGDAEAHFTEEESNKGQEQVDRILEAIKNHINKSYGLQLTLNKD